MKIIHDDSVCASLGICESVAPELFEVSPDGELRILNREPAEGERTRVQQAVASCPTGALSIEG